MMNAELGQRQLDSTELMAWARSTELKISVSQKSWAIIDRYSSELKNILEADKPTYGINTGFGILANVRIPSSDLQNLQLNLIRSHACGVGERLDPIIVRVMMLIKLHNFLHGHSGISRNCVELLIKFIELNITPVVYSQGSVGASGDLAPLSHIALALIGEGECHWEGQIYSSTKIFDKLNLKAWNPGAKEGLSFINGTHLMSALGVVAVESARNLAKTADFVSAMSLDAVRGSLAPFDSRIHELKPHPGQLLVASNFNKIFSDKDEILLSHSNCNKVQDPYSFRCIPQVHGAIRDVIDHVSKVVQRELNSITDNPLIFDGAVTISGGNFHGQAIAMALDYLGISISELGNISQCRIDKLVKPQMSQQPIFITNNPGLHSGFMIPQTVAAALASENKILSHPASVDSIPTNVDQEDHVSMGPISGNKVLKIIQNVENIISIEILAASQAIDLLKPLKPNVYLQSILFELRKISAFVDVDRPLYKDIQAVSEWIHKGGVVNAPRLSIQ